MADDSYNYSYTPTVDHRESNLFIEEYYSSTDTKIYFDNEEQTEIGFISYEIQEQLKPVYGYNSRTFDDVVIGNRIVVGQFTVPIKNKEQQVFVQESISGNNLTNNYQDYNSKEESNLLNTDWFGSTAKNIDAHNNKNIDTDALIKLIALGYNITANASTTQFQNTLKEFQSDNNTGVTGTLDTITKNKIDEEFNKLSKESINLNGATGYDDFAMTIGKTKLSGNGIILNTIPMADGTVYEVLNDVGEKFFIKGMII